MSRFSKKLALLCALGGLSLSLTGCHGSKGLPEFTVPEWPPCTARESFPVFLTGGSP